MLMEGGENIGVSGKATQQFRTFISYTNYMKYLSPLQTYRKVAFLMAEMISVRQTLMKR